MSVRTARHIFAAPLVLAVITGVGLITALVGDGFWDVLSWLTLGLPIVLITGLLTRAARR
jgi:hypothetical protein